MKLALDCGELLPGHRFAITGLRQEGFSDDRLHVDLSDHRPGDRRDPMVSVTYELVPGLSEDETHAGLYVDATVELRRPAWPQPPALSPAVCQANGTADRINLQPLAPSGRSGVQTKRPRSSCTSVQSRFGASHPMAQR